MSTDQLIVTPNRVEDSGADAAKGGDGSADSRAAIGGVIGGRTRSAHTDALAAGRAAIAFRKRRDGIFRAALFSDPAWDLLLDLFVAGLQGRPVSVSSACVAAASPISTSLRHLKKLEQEGYVERSGDPNDGRRAFVRLSEQARRDMLGLFAQSPWSAGMTDG